MQTVYEIHKIDYIDKLWIKQIYKIWDIIFDEKTWNKEKIINIIPNIENFWFKIICQKINDEEKFSDKFTKSNLIDIGTIKLKIYAKKNI